MMIDPPSVCVITAATGHRDLQRCLDSVTAQTLPTVRHLVVIDGNERRPAAARALTLAKPSDRRDTITVPWITGADRWNGHRIYGAMPLLVQSDFVAWLDEDNWFDADHLEKLVRCAVKKAAKWAFSLRKLIRPDGSFIANDDCESLGNLHSTFLGPTDFLVDTSAYLVRRDLAIQLAGAWNRPAGRMTKVSSGADRVLCRALMEAYSDAPCSMRYSLNYAVGSTPESSMESFFVRGNQLQRLKYPDGMPWLPKPANADESA